MRIADNPSLRRKPAANLKAKHGNGNGATEPSSALDMRLMLRALQAVRDGDFSVRLPGDQTGLAGKIADTFNEIVTVESADGARARARRPDRRQARQDAAPHVGQRPRAAPGTRWRTRSIR